MQKFHYRAKDQQGKALVGIVETNSIETAVRLLREKELVILKITPERNFLAFLAKFHRSVSLSDLAAFTRQLAIMINAGVIITEALSILRTQTSGRMLVMVDQLLVDVEGGSSLAGALEKHTDVFSPVYIALIRAGESSGLLDTILTRLADNLEKEREFRAKVKGALIYPVIVIVGMVIVTAVMVIVVIPRLNTLYQEFNAELPAITKALIGLSGIFVKFWFLLAAVFLAGFWGLSLFVKTPLGKRKKDELILRIPIIGPLTRQIILTEFTRTLGLLVGAGVSILESLSVVSRVSDNEVLAAGVRGAAKDVEKGFPLAYSLAQQDAFPQVMTRMLAVGEETGKLDEVLGKISHIFEGESEQQVRTLTSTIEPIVMIILGIGVAILVIAIILPIYNLTSQF